MAIYERKWQEATLQQLYECKDFCKEVLNLRDWDIRLKVQETYEDALGATIINANGFTMRARIDISLKLHKESQISPYVTVCHEMIHILTMGKCHIEDNPCEEFIPRTFEDMLYVMFCEQSGYIELMPKKGNYEKSE